MANCEKVGVFFVRGNEMLEARLLADSELPKAGDSVRLKDRSLHVRINEHCTRPCCAHEPMRDFRVTSVRVLHSGKTEDAFDQVLANRQWQESTCTAHEWCRLFDSYSLAAYLGLEDFDLPGRAAIVDVESSGLRCKE